MNNSKKCISIYKKYIKYKSYTMEYNIYIYINVCKICIRLEQRTAQRDSRSRPTF